MPRPDIALINALATYAWPAFAIFIALFFRTEISDLLKRLKSAGKEGVNFSDSAAEQRLPQKELDDLFDEYESPLIADIVTNIIDALPALPNIAPPDQIELLTRYLAVSVLNTEFEQVEGIIWNSQLRLLRRLHEIEPDGFDLSRLEKHYELAKKTEKIPDAWSVSHYINFLTQRNLMGLDHTVYRISTRGIEYLGWRHRNNKPHRD